MLSLHDSILMAKLAVTGMRFCFDLSNKPFNLKLDRVYTTDNLHWWRIQHALDILCSFGGVLSCYTVIDYLGYIVFGVKSAYDWRYSYKFWLGEIDNVHWDHFEEIQSSERSWEN
ncbi:hypothetical protein POM88_034990 [Heracleum sosnowskyi]|uniref:Uncharacterized protein n=1 Tax=Heracleum sosnowskyi TaxID=360622 RepID=A0AAD8ME78_9APIA|nr:hypothetical protein POM88_034990 [Heracleum sosnowskyi]